MDTHESDNEGSVVSAQENDMSEEEDDDSRMSNGSRNEQPIKPSSIDPDVLARLKQHGLPAFSQEDLGPLQYFLPPHMVASHLAAAAAVANNNKEKDIHKIPFSESPQDRSPIHRYQGDETLGDKQALPSDSSTSSTSSQQTWSFEEQFKQLYELSDDVKRKEFLDDLFSFMQRRGTPINRLPIMAKQVLDLYELYNLVIARGGLVDVINKKLWQEIIKGLRLPSSITSAAFTLRTQYMKYLYPYECETRRLSTPAELQAAIDGNRREGRRASYSPYGPEMISPLSLVGGRPQVNGNGTPNPMHPASPNSSPPNQASNQNARDMAALELSRLTIWNHLYGAAVGLTEPGKAPPQQEALNLEVPTRSSEGAHTPKVPLQLNNTVPTSPRSSIYTPEKEISKRLDRDRHERNDHHDRNHNNHSAPPPPKRIALDEPETPVSRGIPAMPGAHIKINSRGDGLVVSMEINGIMYQGVLFAQNAATTRVS
ncbi:unnamed protein product [Orchesella dallaii]|uniref:Protein dead ringer n=1 Tax=Orchesella dallaii TaxID=48710 RepID=A0ABP1QC07_9HEXA